MKIDFVDCRSSTFKEVRVSYMTWWSVDFSKFSYYEKLVREENSKKQTKQKENGESQR